MQASLALRARQCGDLAPWAATAKAKVSVIYTDFFQGDTSDLVLLLEWVGGRGQGRCLLAFLSLGEDHSQPLNMPAVRGFTFRYQPFKVCR